MPNNHRYPWRGPWLLWGLSFGLTVTAAGQTPPPEDRMKDAIEIGTLSQAPAVSITNGEITVRVYLPDAQKGFYRGTRFDWAGVIGSLTYRGHDFYKPWFHAQLSGVNDFIFQGDTIVASPNTAATGPVEEFNGEGGALGYADAAAGGAFLKIGVGVLRRPDTSVYSPFRQYPIIDLGKRTTSVQPDRVVFTHELTDAGSGYAYRYIKTIRLVRGTGAMMIEHELHNVGTRAIATSVYDHNFLNIDGAGTSPGLEFTTPFALVADRPPSPDLVEISEHRLVYRAAPTGEQRISTGLKGFGPTAGDYNIHIVDPSHGAGLRITADQPLQRLALWSIRPVMAIEPFINMTVEPGQSFRWSYRYDYEAFPARAIQHP